MIGFVHRLLLMQSNAYLESYMTWVTEVIGKYYFDRLIPMNISRVSYYFTRVATLTRTGAVDLPRSCEFLTGPTQEIASTFNASSLGNWLLTAYSME
jgi:hypothetical protein